MPNIQFASRTEAGLLRPDNQDCVYAAQTPGYVLFAVADGMGGHNGGQVASSVAIEQLVASIAQSHADGQDPIDTVRIGIAAANRAVYHMAQENDALFGMGSTLSLMYGAAGQWVTGHVGDSRIYRLHQNHFLKVTSDHTMVQEMVEKGEITEEESRVHPHRNWLRRAVGIDVWVKADLSSFDIDTQDRWLICSDGITTHVSDEEIAHTMQLQLPVQAACDALAELCLARGARDNLSIVYIAPPPTVIG